jgi:hypothetical protein
LEARNERDRARMIALPMAVEVIVEQAIFTVDTTRVTPELMLVNSG